jgi:hypothetical protein
VEEEDIYGVLCGIDVESEGILWRRGVGEGQKEV